MKEEFAQEEAEKLGHDFYESYKVRGALCFKPSGYYQRSQIRATDDPERLRSIALSVITEYERLRYWIVDELGCIPPRWVVPQSEHAAKKRENPRCFGEMLPGNIAENYDLR